VPEHLSMLCDLRRCLSLHCILVGLLPDWPIGFSVPQQDDLGQWKPPLPTRSVVALPARFGLEPYHPRQSRRFSIVRVRLAGNHPARSLLSGFAQSPPGFYIVQFFITVPPALFAAVFGKTGKRPATQCHLIATFSDRFFCA
jgi:hypothetical protein